jgi:hypothetical protein
VQRVLQCSIFLDTGRFGSYNRRPLSLGIAVWRPATLKGFQESTGWLVRVGCKGIYGDDDPIDPHRPQ